MQRLVQRKNGLSVEIKEQIRQMRERDMGYKAISEALNLNPNTVKSHCQRYGLGGPRATMRDPQKSVCKYCGKEVMQNSGRKEKLFCSDKCRNLWWRNNIDKVEKKAIYQYKCEYCHKSFTAYGNPYRKYCSKLCYMTARFGYREYWEGKARIFNADSTTG